MAIWSACTDNSFVSSPDELASGASTASVPVSDGGITPYIIDGENPGGNRTCDEAADAFGTSFENSGNKLDWPENFDGNNATFGPIQVTVTGGTFISWTSSVPVQAAFIVKGSNDANVYYYDCEGGWTGDSGLASPIAGQSGGAAGLSNLTVCWTVCDDEPPVCYKDETAWANGLRYVSAGNWATYTEYKNVAKTETLFAGQTLVAGTVHFSAPSVDNKVTITITLNDGWSFDQNTDENVKIQDYASKPSGNPSPGLFAHKGKATSSPFSIEVPKNKFYGVHTDLLRVVPCPE